MVTSQIPGLQLLPQLEHLYLEKDQHIFHKEFVEHLKQHITFISLQRLWLAGWPEKSWAVEVTELGEHNANTESK